MVRTGESLLDNHKWKASALMPKYEVYNLVYKSIHLNVLKKTMMSYMGKVEKLIIKSVCTHKDLPSKH